MATDKKRAKLLKKLDNKLKKTQKRAAKYEKMSKGKLEAFAKKIALIDTEIKTIAKGGVIKSKKKSAKAAKPSKKDVKKATKKASKVKTTKKVPTKKKSAAKLDASE